MLEVDPDPEMALNPVVDSDPAWIRIYLIPIPALLNAIPAPDLDPQKSGIVTPLVAATYLNVAHRDGVDGGRLADGDAAAGERRAADVGGERGRVGRPLLRGHDEGLLGASQLLFRHRRRPEMVQIDVQGDHSACAKPPVDFKTKVPLWPG